MTQASDAISQLCLMASEALGVGDLDEAARLLDLALGEMNGTIVPERHRAAAQRGRAVVHLLTGEHPRALARLRALRAAVPGGGDETRQATLQLIADIARAPVDLPAGIVGDLLDEAIGGLDLCRAADERTQLDEAMLRLARRAITADCSAAAGMADLARYRGLADRLSRHAQGITRDGGVAMALILGYLTTLAATMDDDVAREANRLITWSDELALWDEARARYASAHALGTAIDRLKLGAGKHHVAGRGVLASELYGAATRLYELIEQHYGSMVAGDVRMATAVAAAAHALLGADALLARKTEATSRMERIREIRDLHPADDKLTQLWLEAPLRYVVTLGRAGTTHQLRAVALRARDDARRHMSRSDYRAWRKRMAGSLDPKFLEQIGF